MSFSHLSNIQQSIEQSGFIRNKSRQSFLAHLIGGMLVSRSVIFSELAAHITKPILQKSLERMTQDFFQKVDFDYQLLLAYFLKFIDKNRKITLSIDRTEWDFGKTQINCLYVIATIGKFGIPLYFKLLDNKSGNSHTLDRKAILEEIIQHVPPHQIQCLVMDREFIGHNWLAFLKEKGIRFCVRVPKHHTILFADGSRKKALDLLENKASCRLHNVVVDGVVVNVSLSKNKQGELIFLIGSDAPFTLKKVYHRRWSIENFFQALKGRGFHLEQSQLKCLKKYRKLFAVASIAYVFCWKTGIEKGKKSPVKRKKHGYPQHSVFRRGLDEIRHFFKTRVSIAFENVCQFLLNPIAQSVKIIG